MALRFQKPKIAFRRQQRYPETWTKESVNEYFARKYPPAPPPTLGIPAALAEIALGTASAIFAKAFIETLGKHAGEGAARLPRHVRELARTRKRRKGRLEEHISASGSAAATIVVTTDLPDEARLALLDLDITADELRGKLLRWDTEAQVWRPESPRGFWSRRSKLT